MKVSVGITTQTDVLLAAKEVFEQAKAKIGNEKIDLAILFGSVDLSTISLLKVIKGYLNGSPLIGCSSQAIIANCDIHRHGAALILISCQGIDISVASVKDIKAKTAVAAGEEQTSGAAHSTRSGTEAGVPRGDR